MRKTAKRRTTPKNIASAGRTPRRGGDINAYEAAGADLVAARRWHLCPVPDLSRLFPVCVWLSPFATLHASVVLPGYHSSILCPRFVIRITIRRRPSKPLLHSTISTATELRKFREK